MSRSDKIIRSLSNLTGMISAKGGVLGNHKDFPKLFCEHPGILSAALFTKNVKEDGIHPVNSFGFNNAELAELLRLLKEPRFNKYNNGGAPSDPAKFIRSRPGVYPLLEKYNFRLSIIALRRNPDERTLLILKSAKKDRLNKQEIKYFTFLASLLVNTGPASEINHRKLQEIERKYHLSVSRIGALLQNMQSGILIEDESRHVLLTNSEFCEMFGLHLTPVDLIGADCAAAIDRSKDLFVSPADFISLIDSLLSNKTVSAGHELELKDGRFFVLDYIPVYVDDNYSGHLWNYRDVTETKHNLAELINAKQMAEESIKAKEMFLAHVSHEIRTPMNAIVGLVSLLLQMKPEGKQKEYLSVIKQSTDNLLVIINDILDFSKITAGKLELESADFVLDDTLHQVQQIMFPKSEEKNLKLSVTKAPDLPSVITGDKVRLGQILLNLLSNAIKFTAKGEVKLSVSLLERTGGSATIRFEVADTGTGISGSQKEALFQDFSQVGEDRSTKLMGTGLGLRITKTLVTLLGGSMNVESEPDRGSVFTVDLLFPVSGRTPESLAGDNTEEPEYGGLRGKKILIAEDNEFNRLVVTNFLDTWGAEYDTAANGKICVDLASSSHYDAILMDLGMPEMDGYEATRNIRSLPGQHLRNIPIIALTASVEKDVKQKILACGMDDYIAKPVKQKDLINKIRFHLHDDFAPAAAITTAPVNEAYKYFNPNDFYGYVGEESEFIVEIVEKFLEQSAEYLTELKGVLDSGSSEKARNMLHRMKSSFGYMGIKSIFDVLSCMEERADSEADFSGLFDDYKGCLEIWKTAETELRTELEKHRKLTL